MESLKTIDQLEREAITKALAENNDLIYKAAVALAITQSQLVRRMKYHGMKVLRNK